MEEGKTFKPHKHIWKNRTRDVIAQESWVVIQGKVKCTLPCPPKVRTDFYIL